MIKDIIELYGNDYHLERMTGVNKMVLYRIKTGKVNPSKTTKNKLDKFFKHTRDLIDIYFENKELKEK